MKHLLRLLLVPLALAPVLLVAAPVTAVDVNDRLCQEAKAKGQGSPVFCADDATTSGQNPIVGPYGVLTRLTRIFSAVLGVAAVIVIIIAGLRFVTASGDAAGVASARRAIIYAVVGLVVAVFAQAIVNLVLVNLD